MTKDELVDLYRQYIACLNRRDILGLDRFVDEAVRYNGTQLSLSGYRAMLEGDFEAIPDLWFELDFAMADPPRVAARLLFDCTPRGALFDLPVNGKRVSFSENVFYEFRDGKIASVWSVIDKAAIAAQVCTGD